MFVLPKGTLVKVGGLPFQLLEDVPTDGSEVNYRLALSQFDTCVESPRQAESPLATLQTKSVSS